MKKAIYILFVVMMSLLQARGQTYGDWKLLGPEKFPVNDWYYINGIGRIEQIKFDPVNPQKIYAASSNGGLFVSADGAQTWKTTGTDSAGLTAASVCIDYTNDSILYLSTGDANFYNGDVGIWKSTDAGVTWKQSNAGIGNRLAIEILMSPTDHNVLIACTDDGIWKSTDAGSSWAEKHVGGTFTDMQFKANPLTQTLYAVTDSSYWYSANLGETWNRVALPVIPAALQHGGRIGVSKADSNVVYLTFVGDDSANCTPIVKSADGGLSFSVVRAPSIHNLNAYDTNQVAGLTQDNYNYCMIVDPGNINIIYIAAECIWKSMDGGNTWTTSYPWYYGVHCDMHYFAFYPTDPTRLFNANDGGVWESRDSNKTWTPVSDGLSASECYHAANSPIDKDFVMAGLQDNGGNYYNNSFPWHSFGSGDATQVWAMDNSDSTLIFDVQNGLCMYGANPPDTISFPFKTKKNSNLLIFPATLAHTAFASDSGVFIARNMKYPNRPVWTKIFSGHSLIMALASSPADSNLLFAVTQSDSLYYTQNALAPSPSWVSYITPSAVALGACIAPSANDPNILYLSCGNNVYRTDNKGAVWQKVTYNLPGTDIIKIINDESRGSEAIYVATAQAIYYKDSLASNWINFSKGLPNTCNITDMMMFNDGTDSSKLRVAFYGRGVWQSPLYRTLYDGISTVKGYSNAVIIFPNPNNGVFTIRLNYENIIKAGTLKAEFYNVLGQKVFIKILASNQGDNTVDLRSQSAGVYFCKVIAGNDVIVGEGKVIIMNGPLIY